MIRRLVMIGLLIIVFVISTRINANSKPESVREIFQEQDIVPRDSTTVNLENRNRSRLESATYLQPGAPLPTGSGCFVRICAISPFFQSGDREEVVKQSNRPLAKDPENPNKCGDPITWDKVKAENNEYVINNCCTNGDQTAKKIIYKAGSTDIVTADIEVESNVYWKELFCRGEECSASTSNRIDRRLVTADRFISGEVGRINEIGKRCDKETNRYGFFFYEKEERVIGRTEFKFTIEVEPITEEKKIKLDIPEKVWDTIIKGLTEVTTVVGSAANGGTAAKSFTGFPYKVAGKTGTAQNPKGAPHAWFVGFAPVDDPQYSVLVLIELGESGGHNAAPVARKVFDYLYENNFFEEKSLENN